ncbi:MAG: hypothetical protein AB7L92_08345 [Alphaproteobacteria bacterium]
MTQNNPEKLFDDVRQFIADSRAIIARGDMLQLDGLDSEVQRLCEAVLQLSQDERLKYAGTLQELLYSLNALGEELSRQRDVVAAQIHDLSDHRRANVAYKKADATDDFGKKDDE